MAGSTGMHTVVRGHYEFFIDTPDVANKIRERNKNRKVVVLQLDGNELEAAHGCFVATKTSPGSIDHLPITRGTASLVLDVRTIALTI